MPAFRTANCRRCGERFEYKVQKGKAPMYCGKVCREADRRRYFREWSQARRPRVLETKCKTCGAPIVRSQGEMGQPKKFCDAECRQRYRSVEKHGLGDGRYVALLEAQGGGCAICGTTEPGGSYGRNFAIDHCHDTEAVRGLLCSHCNRGIGYFRDDPTLLRAAAEYIERSRQLCLT